MSRSPDQDQPSILEGSFLNGYEVLDLVVGVNASGGVAIAFQRDNEAEQAQLLVLTRHAAHFLMAHLESAIETAQGLAPKKGA
jgi:hypothetical protein